MSLTLSLQWNIPPHAHTHTQTMFQDEVLLNFKLFQLFKNNFNNDCVSKVWEAFGKLSLPLSETCPLWFPDG